MAVLTPDATDPGTVGGVANIANGLKHVRLPFITQTVDSGDTYLPGGEVVIVQAAWETATGVGVATIIAPSAVAWTAGTAATGYLHLWISA